MTSLRSLYMRVAEVGMAIGQRPGGMACRRSMRSGSGQRYCSFGPLRDGSGLVLWKKKNQQNFLISFSYLKKISKSVRKGDSCSLESRLLPTKLRSSGDFDSCSDGSSGLPFRLRQAPNEINFGDGTNKNFGARTTNRLRWNPNLGVESFKLYSLGYVASTFFLLVWGR